MQRVRRRCSPARTHELPPSEVGTSALATLCRCRAGIAQNHHKRERPSPEPKAGKHRFITQLVEVVVDVAGTVVDVASAVVDVTGVVVEVAVVVPAAVVPGLAVVVVGGSGVVVAELLVADVVVVVSVVLVVVAAVVVVVAVTGAETLSGPEAPNMPDELSVTSSTVVAGSTRATLTVATPAAKLTLLPVLQSPGAG